MIKADFGEVEGRFSSAAFVLHLVSIDSGCVVIEGGVCQSPECAGASVGV